MSFDLAWQLAIHYHTGQKYGTNDYSYHLQQVVDAVEKAYPNDERLKIVAALHDIVEDTAIPSHVIGTLFEDKIWSAVVALTKVSGEEQSDYEERVKANPMALKVKLCDASCNMLESLKRGDMGRVRKYSSLITRLAEKA